MVKVSIKIFGVNFRNSALDNNIQDEINDNMGINNSTLEQSATLFETTKIIH